ncbi:MAG TPA: LptE family protein [bacterium]|nr:LptE family protein [bacterium]
MRRDIASTVLLVLVSLLVGCGYNLVGKGGALPKHVKRISIPVFKNETLETGLEALVTDAVVESFMKRGGLEITESSADARLKGTVTSYKLKQLSYNSEGVANEYRVLIDVKVELTDLKNEKPLFSASKLSVEKDYKVDEVISGLYPLSPDHEAGNVSTRQQAQQKALKMAAADLASKITSAILDTF